MKNKTLIVVAVLALAGCGGGAAGVTPPKPAAVTTPSAAASNLQFVITIPAPASISAATRAPKYVSPSTQSIAIALQGGSTIGAFDVSGSSRLCASVAGGGRQCTVPVNVPAGNDTFVLTGYDQPNGTGNVLERGAVVESVGSSGTSTANVSLTGLMSRFKFAVSNRTPAAGTASTSTISVQALDASGNTIIGAYDHTITFADSDTSGHASLSGTTISNSADTLTLKYTGALATSATITAAAPGMPAVDPVTFAPEPVQVAKYEFPLVLPPGFFQPVSAGASSIVVGPDGNFWIVGATESAIIRMKPDLTTQTYYTPTQNSAPQMCVVGKDGAIWFTERDGNNIGRIDMQGNIIEYPLPTQSASPLGLTLGPDGDVWFAESVASQIGKIDTAGNVTEYPAGAATNPQDLTVGPDGNLWIDEDVYPYKNAIAVMSPQGAVLKAYPLPNGDAAPLGIITGPDKNLWFGEYKIDKIARMTPSGAITEYTAPSSAAGIVGLESGPDGNVWFAENSAGFTPSSQLGYIKPGTSDVHEIYLNDRLHTRALTFDSSGALWYVGFDGAFTSAVGKVLY